jgi:hypothetical protein
MKPKTEEDGQLSHQETVARRDAALRRALNTPPKQHKDMKKGRSRKRQEDHPATASEKRT